MTTGRDASDSLHDVELDGVAAGRAPAPDQPTVQQEDWCEWQPKSCHTQLRRPSSDFPPTFEAAEARICGARLAPVPWSSPVQVLIG